LKSHSRLPELHRGADSNSQIVKYTRIATNAAGVSFFEEGDVPLAEAGEIGRLSSLLSANGIIFRETGDTYDYDWHPAPQRQWILLLDGEIEIEVGTGEKRRFRGGDILRLEDVDGRGHRTRQLSSGPRRSVFIPF